MDNPEVHSTDATPTIMGGEALCPIAAKSGRTAGRSIDFKRHGPNAASLLEDIADDDLRLFAQIEFAAALAGLPASHETSMKRRPPPMQGPPLTYR
jgi:hypothetical protein